MLEYLRSLGAETVVPGDSSASQDENPAAVMHHDPEDEGNNGMGAA
jgi:hypothetical protein